MSQVKAVISDIGNVAVLVNEQLAIDEMANLAGVTAVQVKNAVFGDGTDQDAVFRRFMRGEFDDEEFRRLVGMRLDRGSPLPKEKFERAFCDIFAPNQPVLDLWLGLRQAGLTVTAVSNIDALRYRWLDRTGWLSVFDELVLSFEEGLLKPSEELMVRSLDRTGVAAEEAVFIDDKAKNLPPCGPLGIRAHRFAGFAGLRRFLRENGVAC